MARTRITINPVAEWSEEAQRYVLVSHDGQYETDCVPMRCDRGATSQAKTQGKQANTVAGTAGTDASVDRSALVPGIIQQANNPTGFTPLQKNNLLVGNQESIGGANSGLVGQAALAAARTRNSGGFAPALDEAARIKGRQLASSNLAVGNADTALANEKQARAQQMLAGLYGTDTSNQLRAMGLQGQDLSNQLQAGRQGWLQDTTQVLGALGQLGQGVGAAAKGFGG